MKQIWRFHDAKLVLLRNLWSILLFGLALPLPADPISANRCALDAIVSTLRPLFGGRKWMFMDENELWCVTNVAVTAGFPLEVSINPSDDFATLLIFDIVLPKDSDPNRQGLDNTEKTSGPINGFMKAVECFFAEREVASRKMQPLRLYRFNGQSFGYLGSLLDEFDIEGIMYMAEWFDLQPDYFTSYRERRIALVDPDSALLPPWSPWCETNTWTIPPYAQTCKSPDEVQKAALYPYTNALSRVKAKLGGVTWMETHEGGAEQGRKLKRAKPALGARISCDMQATDPPTYVLFTIDITPVGTFTNDPCWERCRSAARERAEDAISDYYSRLWGRRDCYRPRVEKVIDGKSERECHPRDSWLPQRTLSPEQSRLVASNIWEAQILKCTPDALFTKPHCLTNTFDFAKPNASRFSSPMVTAATLEAYSNAISRIKTRFLGTNAIAVSSTSPMTPVVITDVRVGIVPPILELRLASMPGGDGAKGLEALRAFSNELKRFIKTLPKMERVSWTFYPCYFIDEQEIHVEAGNLSEKQLAGGHFQTGMYWSKGYFNVPDDSPPETSGGGGDD